jgi:NAD(P)-dependent dehydrogenase (short-subunit alcohol dehydrogenase family)
VGLAKALALDLARSGITVNVVAPGWFDSPLAEEWKSNPKLAERILDHTAQRRWGSRHRSGRRLPVPGVRRVGVRDRYGALRRRRVPAGMTDSLARSHRDFGGRGRSLGAALSRQFAGEPDTDLVLSDLSAPSLEATLGGLPEPRGAGGDGSGGCERFRPGRSGGRLAVERFGRLDVLISNAGVLSPNGRIHNLATEDWERAFRVNVLGAVNGIRAAVPVMREQRSGPSSSRRRSPA